MVLALSPIPASTILREHLRRAVVARPAMTATQREVIADAQAFLAPAWFARDRQERVAIWHERFGHRIDAAFSFAERVRIFESVGPEDDGIHARIGDATARSAPDTARYDDFAALAVDDQITAWADASPAVKAEIDRGHFERLAMGQEVTVTQREALLHAAALVALD